MIDRLAQLATVKVQLETLVYGPRNLPKDKESKLLDVIKKIENELIDGAIQYLNEDTVPTKVTKTSKILLENKKSKETKSVEDGVKIIKTEQTSKPEQDSKLVVVKSLPEDFHDILSKHRDESETDAAPPPKNSFKRAK